MERHYPTHARRCGVLHGANAVFESVRDERFYILPHPRIKPAIEARMRDILDESMPRDPLKLH
jgi:hypothetical protein